MSDPYPTTFLQELNGLKETLKQIDFQNEMMLRWVNGAVITVDREGMVKDWR